MCGGRGGAQENEGEMSCGTGMSVCVCVCDTRQEMGGRGGEYSSDERL